MWAACIDQVHRQLLSDSVYDHIDIRGTGHFNHRFWEELLAEALEELFAYRAPVFQVALAEGEGGSCDSTFAIFGYDCRGLMSRAGVIGRM